MYSKVGGMSPFIRLSISVSKQLAINEGVNLKMKGLNKWQKKMKNKSSSKGNYPLNLQPLYKSSSENRPRNEKALKL